MIGKRWLAIALCACACGSKKDADQPAAGSGTDAQTLAPLVAPPLGVDAVKRMNYPYGEGASDFAKAQAAAKKQDWAELKADAESAVKRDPMHLDAQWLLGTALVHDGDYAGAASHFAIALAGDPVAYAPRIAGADLASFVSTPQGKQVMDLSASLRQQVQKLLATAPIVIGRRSTFKLPAKTGYATSRGELYALDVDGSRFVRLTHTGESVVAWMPSPSLAEIVVVGFDKLELPASADAPVMLGRTWIETYDAKTFAPTGKRATIPKARGVEVYYAAGDQLIAIAFPGSGRWDRGVGVAYSIDRASGKATKTKAPGPEGGQIYVSLDDANVALPIHGIDATWDGDTTGELKVVATQKAIAVPESGKAALTQIAVSPGKTRVAFVTAADPCATDGSLPSLYEFDGASGQLKHILTAASRFGARWIDDTRLVYEDDEGGLRVYDAAAGRELLHLTERGGLAIYALALSPKPICKTAPPPPPPPAPAGSGSASDEAPPPEPAATP